MIGALRDFFLRRAALGFAALVLASAPGCQPKPAHAQVLACGNYAAIKQDLAQRYHEEPIGGGIVTDKVIMQVFASPDGATWTLISIGSDGKACFAGAGKDWEPGKLPVKEGRT